MKRTLLTLSAALAAIAPAARAVPANSPPRPNILLLYADDIGFGDLSCYGAKRLSTPHCDELAREGLRFTDAHSSSSTCTPSRFSLLTGEYPFRQKGTDILAGDAGLIINTNRATLPGMLQSAGYSTGIVGKWHLGLGGKTGVDWNGEIGPGPREVGFAYSFIIPATPDRVPTVYVENGHVVGLDPADPLKVSYHGPLDDSPTGDSRPDLLKMRADQQHSDTIVDGISRIGWESGGNAARWKDEAMSDTLTAKAISFLDAQRPAKPFFLYFASNNIHVPRAPAARWVGKTPMGPRGDSILEFDGSVGRIMDELKRRGLDQNTLVILSSDNGPVVLDGYFDGSFKKLGAHKPAGPYRGGKYSIYEGGTRMPFVVVWPGHVHPGVSDALISQGDLLASLAALTGTSLGPGDAPDSRNVLPALLGQSTQGRADFVEYSNGEALRSGQWKFVPPGPGHTQPQLFNLTDDIGEKTNLAAADPDRAAQLAARLQQIEGADLAGTARITP